MSVREFPAHLCKSLPSLSAHLFISFFRMISYKNASMQAFESVKSALIALPNNQSISNNSAFKKTFDISKWWNFWLSLSCSSAPPWPIPLTSPIVEVSSRDKINPPPDLTLVILHRGQNRNLSSGIGWMWSGSMHRSSWRHCDRSCHLPSQWTRSRAHLYLARQHWWRVFAIPRRLPQLGCLPGHFKRRLSRWGWRGDCLRDLRFRDSRHVPCGKLFAANKTFFWFAIHDDEYVGFRPTSSENGTWRTRTEKNSCVFRSTFPSSNLTTKSFPWR